LEKETQNPKFWKDPEGAIKKNQKLNNLRNELSNWQKIEQDCVELKELSTLALKENDQEIISDIKKRKLALEKDFHKLENLLFLGGEYDSYNAIITVHSGTGGVEACDWAEMLFKMYLGFTKFNNYKATILDRLPNKEAGIKNATLEIKGRNAYGFLKSERGVHRLVRISPFDADHARHTSFALVEIVPEVEREIEIEIRPEDIKIETFRSSGPGGQHANVTASAVRIIHLPTKITASSQSDRSQGKNKEIALKVLKSRLLERKIEEQEKKINKIRGETIEASWGNQIRSYVLHPYQQVRDHRTGYETSKTHDVLEGKIMPFIESYLRWYIKI
jgi:peptide chain release factor 2